MPWPHSETGAEPAPVLVAIALKDAAGFRYVVPDRWKRHRPRADQMIDQVHTPGHGQEGLPARRGSPKCDRCDGPVDPHGGALERQRLPIGGSGVLRVEYLSPVRVNETVALSLGVVAVTMKDRG